MIGIYNEKRGFSQCYGIPVYKLLINLCLCVFLSFICLQILIEATAGSSYTGDIAIDNVILNEDPNCTGKTLNYEMFNEKNFFSDLKYYLCNVTLAIFYTLQDWDFKFCQ